MRKLSGILPYFIFIAVLTMFYMRFSFSYMKYFNIGVNDGTRVMDIYLTLTPTAILAQVVTLSLFDKFAGRRLKRWRIWLNFIAVFFAVCIVFFGFSLYSDGISREGGFLRFLGYYFFGLEPGRIPSG